MANERKTQAYIDALKVHPEWAIGDDEQQDADALDIAKYGKPTRFMSPAEIAALPHTFIEPVSGTPIAVPQVQVPAMKPVQSSLIPPQFPPSNPPFQTPQEIVTIQPTQAPLKPFKEMPDAADYKAFLDSIQELIGHIGTSITEQIETKLAPPTTVIGTIKNKQIGHIQKKLDDCEKKLVKAQDKVLKPISQQMGQCYGYFMPCGMPYPTQEQVIYGLQTGNYMQSVGIPYPPGTIVNQQQNIQQPPDRVYTQQPNQNTLVSQQSNQPTVVNETTNNYTTNETINQVSPTQISQPINRLQTEPDQTRNISLQNEYIGGTSSHSQTSTVEFYPLLGGDITQAVQPDNFVKPPDVLDLPIGPERVGLMQSPKWDFANVCAAIKAGTFDGDVHKALGFYKDETGRHAPQWWLDAWGFPPNGDTTGFGAIKRRAESVLWWSIRGINWVGGEIIDKIERALGCEHLPGDAMIIKAVSGFINHWTNDAFSGLMKGFEYEVNQACPQEIPSQADIDDLYLADELTIEQWECYTKANNNLPQLATKNMVRKREHLSFDDALKLYRLEKMDHATFVKHARRNGYLNANDINNAMQAAVDVPTVSDLIRMMVRDVGDPEIVKEYGMDDQFEQKWSGELETYANAQGMSPEIAKLHWRAHWDHPSATQAFEMLHRLRPDSKWAQKLQEQLSVEAGTRGVKSAGVITTAADVQRLLEVNDLSWYWRERLGAISYNALTRTDIFRAFMIGSIKEDDLKSYYQDAGYTAYDADMLVQFAIQQKKERDTRKQGSRDTSKLKALYVKGLMTLDEFKAEINVRVPNEEKRKNILQDATTEEFYNTRAKKITCTKNEYKMGILDEVQAKAALVKAGISIDNSIDMVEQWYCQHSKKAKTVSASQLCEWRERHLITPEQHLTRLVNLGYKLADAEIIVNDCGISANEKTRRQIVAQIKLAAAQADKLAKQQARAVKAEQVAENKAAKAEKKES